MSVDERFFSEIGRETIKLCQERYGECNCSDERIKHRIDRINDILQAFAKELLPKSVYDASMLYEATSALNFDDESSSEARRLLCLEYLSNPNLSPEKTDYVTAVLGDLNYMDNEANAYRANPNIYNSGGKDIRRLSQIVQDAYQNGLELSDWDVRAERIDVDRMKSVLHQVNLESVMIKSAQLLDDLHKYHDHSDIEIFHKITEAESFYAPICETIGLDGFSSALRDKALQIRYEKMGRTDILNRARELYTRASDYGAERVVACLAELSDNKSNYVVEQVAGQRLNGENIVNTGDFLLRLADKLPVARGVYRIKLIGSLADKIYKDPRYAESLPMDMVAYTFILNNETDLQLILADVVDKMKQTRAELCPTAGKTEAIFVQGSPDRVRQIEYFLGRDGTPIETKISGKGDFQAARVTFKVKNEQGEPIGMEIQFLTATDRKEARLGSASHILYKMGKHMTPEEVKELGDFMLELSERKQYMSRASDQFTINKRSLARGEKWRQNNLLNAN